MKLICVDDERLLMEDTVALCRTLEQVDEAVGFTRPVEALKWLEHERVDVALLDINMPGVDGIELATVIKQKWPHMAVIFLTGYSQYALDAFAVHASGYLLKPVKRDALESELAYAARTFLKNPTGSRVQARTFGNFDLLVDGRPVVFSQAKCKELLAYLIDRRGATVTRREAFTILWEDRQYDRRMQKQLDAILRSLRTTLSERGVGEIIEVQSGTLRVNPESIDCDAWRWLSGERDAANAFYGEYMSNYSWASFTEGSISSNDGEA